MEIALIVIFTLLYMSIVAYFMYRIITKIKDIKTCKLKIKAAVIDCKKGWFGRCRSFTFDVAFRYNGETIRTELISLDRKIQKLSKEKIIDILYVEDKKEIYWANESIAFYIMGVVAFAILDLSVLFIAVSNIYYILT